MSTNETNNQAHSEPYSREYYSSGDSEDKTTKWMKERKAELSKILERKSNELARKTQVKLSDHMHHYENAVRSASESLHDDSEYNSAKIADAFAQQIAHAKTYLQSASPEQIYETTSQKVRTTPLISLGASIAVGFVIGRLLTTANQDESVERSQEFPVTASPM